MTDSDHSTTLPSVTRRRLMKASALVSALCPFGDGARGAAISGSQPDPAIAVCQNWQKTHAETLALCKRQQQLETYLARTIGFPCARVLLRDGRNVTLHSVDSLNDVCSPDDEAMWGRALADFASHQARWDAADAEIGYSRTQQLERKSQAAEKILLDELPLILASSIEGVLAKLSVILCDGEQWEDSDDFPWSHIRSVLNDLARLHDIDPDVVVARSNKRGDQNHCRRQSCCVRVEPFKGRTVK